jgi:hypothetical protein
MHGEGQGGVGRVEAKAMRDKVAVHIEPSYILISMYPDGLRSTLPLSAQEWGQALQIKLIKMPLWMSTITITRN